MNPGPNASAGILGRAAPAHEYEYEFAVSISERVVVGPTTSTRAKAKAMKTQPGSTHGRLRRDQKAGVQITDHPLGAKDVPAAQGTQAAQ